MFIESEFKILSANDAELAHIQQQLKESLAGIAGAVDNLSISVKAVSLEPLITSIKSAEPFLDSDLIEFVEELMDEFNLTSARFAFMPTPEWGYGLLTDQGLEYFGSLNVEGLSPDFYDPTHSQFNLIQHIPIELQFLALLSSEPNDALLAEFRSCRYSWIGLLDDVDRDSFYTKENIAAIWDKPEEASRYFIPDRATAFKLAGFVR
jgi:hypothetical protein